MSRSLRRSEEVLSRCALHSPRCPYMHVRAVWASQRKCCPRSTRSRRNSSQNVTSSVPPGQVSTRWPSALKGGFQNWNRSSTRPATGSDPGAATDDGRVEILSTGLQPVRGGKLATQASSAPRPAPPRAAPHEAQDQSPCGPGTENQPRVSRTMGGSTTQSVVSCARQRPRYENPSATGASNAPARRPRQPPCSEFDVTSVGRHAAGALYGTRALPKFECASGNAASVV